MTLFLLAVLGVATFAGATAAVVGFGIGSMLTPLLATRYPMPIAVGAVAIPHALATAIRCWRLRASIDRGVLLTFGLLSAGGALAGALVHRALGPSILTAVLGGLLILTAVAQVTGWTKRLAPRGVTASALGLASGFFGGVAGNQGGLRSAALTTFPLAPAAFVATGTAVGLMVDAARMPVYLLASGRALLDLGWPIGLAIVGTIAGTLIGERVLLGLTREQFARIVGGAIGLLGIWLIVSVL